MIQVTVLMAANIEIRMDHRCMIMKVNASKVESMSERIK